MSDSSSRAPREDQEWENNEPLIKALTNEEEEPLPSEPPTPTENYPNLEKDDASSIEKEAAVAQPQESHPVSRFTSRRSATTQNTESSHLVPQKKSWNPLKRNPPPIPAERGVSHEYLASPVSKLFFQWMTPILSVRFTEEPWP
jgi:ATP-binding cassette, subfamily C (CFTR/MRP), member 1